MSLTPSINKSEYARQAVQSSWSFWSLPDVGLPVVASVLTFLMTSRPLYEASLQYLREFDLADDEPAFCSMMDLASFMWQPSGDQHGVGDTRALPTNITCLSDPLDVLNALLNALVDELLFHSESDVAGPGCRLRGASDGNGCLLATFVARETRCVQCNATTQTLHKRRHIVFDIDVSTPGAPIDLVRSLRKFGTIENMPSHQDAFSATCARCRQPATLLKTSLPQPPSVLLIHLNRQRDDQTWRSNPVDFGMYQVYETSFVGRARTPQFQISAILCLFRDKETDVWRCSTLVRCDSTWWLHEGGRAVQMPSWDAVAEYAASRAYLLRLEKVAASAD